MHAEGKCLPTASFEILSHAGGEQDYNECNGDGKRAAEGEGEGGSIDEV